MDRVYKARVGEGTTIHPPLYLAFFIYCNSLAALDHCNNVDSSAYTSIARVIQYKANVTKHEFLFTFCNYINVPTF